MAGSSLHSEFLDHSNWLYLPLLNAGLTSQSDDWVDSYHGTLGCNVTKICSDRHLKVPDGVNVLVRPGHIPNVHKIFTSPSVRYAAFGLYSSPFEVHGSFWQAVLKVRQEKGSFTIGRETAGMQNTHRNLEEGLSNKELEWSSTVSDKNEVIGILVRPIVNSQPQTLPSGTYFRLNTLEQCFWFQPYNGDSPFELRGERKECVNICVEWDKLRFSLLKMRVTIPLFNHGIPTFEQINELKGKILINEHNPEVCDSIYESFFSKFIKFSTQIPTAIQQQPSFPDVNDAAKKQEHIYANNISNSSTAVNSCTILSSSAPTTPQICSEPPTPFVISRSSSYRDSTFNVDFSALNLNAHNNSHNTNQQQQHQLKQSSLIFQQYSNKQQHASHTNISNLNQHHHYHQKVAGNNIISNVSGSFQFNYNEQQSDQKHQNKLRGKISLSDIINSDPQSIPFSAVVPDSTSRMHYEGMASSNTVDSGIRQDSSLSSRQTCDSISSVNNTIISQVNVNNNNNSNNNNVSATNSCAPYSSLGRVSGGSLLMNPHINNTQRQSSMSSSTPPTTPLTPFNFYPAKTHNSISIASHQHHHHHFGATNIENGTDCQTTCVPESTVFPSRHLCNSFEYCSTVMDNMTPPPSPQSFRTGDLTTRHSGSVFCHTATPLLNLKHCPSATHNTPGVFNLHHAYGGRDSTAFSFQINTNNIEDSSLSNFFGQNNSSKQNSNSFISTLANSPKTAIFGESSSVCDQSSAVSSQSCCNNNTDDSPLGTSFVKASGSFHFNNISPCCNTNVQLSHSLNNTVPSMLSFYGSASKVMHMNGMNLSHNSRCPPPYSLENGMSNPETVKYSPSIVSPITKGVSLGTCREFSSSHPPPYSGANPHEDLNNSNNNCARAAPFSSLAVLSHSTSRSPLSSTLNSSASILSDALPSSALRAPLKSTKQSSSSAYTSPAVHHPIFEGNEKGVHSFNTLPPSTPRLTRNRIEAQASAKFMQLMVESGL